MSVVAAGALALTRVTWLADDTDVGDETHKAGPIAILVVAILCVACFVLFRSMTKHLRRVREEFPEDRAESMDSGEPAGPDVPSATGGVSASAPAARGPAPKSRPRAADDASHR